MGAELTIYADGLDTEAVAAQQRGALGVWSDALADREAAIVYEDFGFRPERCLFVRTRSPRYRGELRDFLLDVLERAPGDVVILSDGDLVVQRRAGRMEYVLFAEDWRRMLDVPPQPLAAK